MKTLLLLVMMALMHKGIFKVCLCFVCAASDQSFPSEFSELQNQPLHVEQAKREIRFG